MGPATSGPTSLSDLFYRFAEFLEKAVVMVAGQQMPGRDDDRDGPIDQFESCEGGQPAVVGQLFRPRYLDLPDPRKVYGEGLASADFLHGLGLGRCPASLLFRHHLPFSN